MIQLFNRRVLSFVPVIAFLLGIVFSIGGCSQQKRPDGMPELYPCTITITQDGKPFEGAIVRLYSNDVVFHVSGTTNASGTAVMLTHGEFKGAPEGTYKVTVSKEEKEFIEPESVTAAREKAKEQGEAFEEPALPYKFYSYVEKEYTSKETTPLEITVSKGKNDQTFAAGKAERIFLGEMKPE